ncbi:MAG TPA: class F sortase [Tepidiformaceae bacterium]|nr:class F sortase [Tepidiformaceae bacterium]
MKVLPYLAIFTFVAGLSLLVVGYAFQPADQQVAPEPPPLAFDIRSTATSTPTSSPTPPPTDVPTATPTPLPFDGSIARMVAESVGIDHPIEEIGLLPNNQLDVPKDGVNKVGWYHIYEKPGWGKNAVFAAHVNYNFKQGPFAKLKDVKAGDQIRVQMDGGPEYVYEVFYFKRYDLKTIPMGDLINGILDGVSRPEGEEWITLITCGGRFQQTQASGLGEYLDRDVVVARRVQ